ncbi:MAG: DUF1223 domain-containing protein [Bacteroidota bacterium]|nr:DUF1223 domain-containing protein [Bacteroidota bacterium]
MKKNKKEVLFIMMVLLLLMSCFSFDSKKITEKNKREDGKGFTVIELFTSEGCSSCPSADALVSRILNENKKDVYILSFHVDYWNRLGWKDVFSNAAFSERQQLYASHLALNGVYTPQIVVNGIEEFVGSDEDRLRSSLNKKQPSTLTIEAVKTNSTTIHLAYNNANSNGELLNIAFIQPEAITDVKRGENGGRKLHHVNIVREFKTIEAANSGSMDFDIPLDLREISFKIIAFIQHKKDFKITGAAQTDIVFTGKRI